MNHVDRDKFLTEAMGFCYHEWNGESEPYHDGARKYFCKCGGWETYGGFFYSDIPTVEIINKQFKQTFNFSAWEGFAKLWSWCKQQDWCESFYGFATNHCSNPFKESYWACTTKWIDPDLFANTLYIFLSKGNK